MYDFKIDHQAEDMDMRTLLKAKSKCQFPGVLTQPNITH